MRSLAPAPQLGTICRLGRGQGALAPRPRSTLKTLISVIRVIRVCVRLRSSTTNQPDLSCDFVDRFCSCSLKSCSRVDQSSLAGHDPIAPQPDSIRHLMLSTVLRSPQAIQDAEFVRTGSLRLLFSFDMLLVLLLNTRFFEAQASHDSGGSDLPTRHGTNSSSSGGSKNGSGSSTSPRAMRSSRSFHFRSNSL